MPLGSTCATQAVFMEAENMATELPQSSEWEVYKDAFAPPQLTRRTKPWDRETVSAHTPRLHGQKIWKKAGSKVRGHEFRENDNAQAELDREGMGARKKMRGTGEKENISNAKWLLNSGGNGENEADVLGSLSPVKKDGSSFKSNALLVPRKRTNANHLITPRKSTRKTPLQDLTQNVVDNLKIPDELVATADGSLSPAVKPARRTKSMRKSFRRLSHYDSVEEIPESQVEVGEADSESVSVETLASEPAQEPVSSQPVDIFGTSSGVQSNVEIIEVEEQPSVCFDELRKAEETFEDREEGATSVEQLNILPTLLEEESTGVEPTIVHAEVPQDNSALVLIHEYPAKTESLLTTKISETPKKRVKSRNSRTPKTSPVKRRARATRSSSFLPEAQTTGMVQESDNLNELSAEAHSPCKAQHTQQPRTTNITPPNQSQGRTHNDEVSLNMIGTIVDSAADPSPQIQDDVTQNPILENNEMEDIQDALNIEATGSFDFDLPQPAEHIDYEAMNPSLGFESATNFDLPAPELPDHNVAEGVPRSPVVNDSQSLTSDDISETSENFEGLDEITLSLGHAVKISSGYVAQTLPEPSSTTDIIEDAPGAVYNRDDTDLLRSFLTRVKADKAAKASKSIPKRKRSLPHSPLQLPLGTTPAVSSPSSPKAKDDIDEFDVSLPTFSPSKRRKIGERNADEDELTQPRPTRRSGRTRLPVKSAPLGAPSFIPVRRLGGQDGDNTVTLQKNAEKELATLTKFNTRKNKGGASLPPAMLAKKAEEKEDPAAKHKALKETFDDMVAAKKGKNKKGRNVVWAEEIAQFQTAAVEVESEPILPPTREKKVAAMAAKQDDKKPVKVGMRSKIALGMAANGTPAPKRQLKPRKK